MPVKERVEFLLKQTKLSQSEFASRSGYSNVVLSNFLTGKTEKPRIDLLEALVKVFPTLNLNWLITGLGDIWDGPAPENLTDLPPPQQDYPSNPEQELLNRLLIQKLEAVAKVLRERDPELYEELRLGELVGIGKKG